MEDGARKEIIQQSKYFIAKCFRRATGHDVDGHTMYVFNVESLEIKIPQRMKYLFTKEMVSKQVEKAGWDLSGEIEIPAACKIPGKEPDLVKPLAISRIYPSTTHHEPGDEYLTCSWPANLGQNNTAGLQIELAGMLMMVPQTELDEIASKQMPDNERIKSLLHLILETNRDLLSQKDLEIFQQYVDGYLAKQIIDKTATDILSTDKQREEEYR